METKLSYKKRERKASWKLDSVSPPSLQPTVREFGLVLQENRQLKEENEQLKKDNSTLKDEVLACKEHV